jgi:hypothetical protein
MVIWHATQQPADYVTEQQLGQLAARWTRLFRRTGRAQARAQADLSQSDSNPGRSGRSS